MPPSANGVTTTPARATGRELAPNAVVVAATNATHKQVDATPVIAER
jgi:hypothetical protein